MTSTKSIRRMRKKDACVRKKTYWWQWWAEFKAQRITKDLMLKNRIDRPLKVYKCEVCSYFHLTKGPPYDGRYSS